MKSRPLCIRNDASAILDSFVESSGSGARYCTVPAVSEPKMGLAPMSGTRGRRLYFK